MHLEFNTEGGDFANAGAASSSVKNILRKMGIDPAIIRRVVVAIYEAEVNVVAHAYRGKVLVDIQPEEICVRVVDEGPGIADIELAMTEGYSTASEKVREMGFGAGMGLPNIKKNADVFMIESVVGQGTDVWICNKLS